EISERDQAMLRERLPSLFTPNRPEYPQLDEAIRALMASGSYENVFVQRNGERYEIVGKPLRVIEDIQFTGVEQFSESDLKEIIEISPGDRFDRKRAVTAGEKIKEFYGE